MTMLVTIVRAIPGLRAWVRVIRNDPKNARKSSTALYSVHQGNEQKGLRSQPDDPTLLTKEKALIMACYPKSGTRGTDLCSLPKKTKGNACPSKEEKM